MSASEKLRALEKGLQVEPHSVREIDALFDALPQIVAVVEVADEHCLCFGLGTIQMVDGSRQPCPVHAALAALDEALP